MEFGAIVGFRPGFVGGMNWAEEMVSCTSGFSVRKIRPSCQLLLLLQIDTALVFNLRWAGDMVSKVGCSMMGEIVGWGKFPMILSADDVELIVRLHVVTET